MQNCRASVLDADFLGQGVSQKRFHKLFQRDWFLRLLAEFLKSRISAQRVPDRIELKSAGVMVAG